MMATHTIRKDDDPRRFQSRPETVAVTAVMRMALPMPAACYVVENDERHDEADKRGGGSHQSAWVKHWLAHAPTFISLSPEVQDGWIS